MDCSFSSLESGAPVERHGQRVVRWESGKRPGLSPKRYPQRTKVFCSTTHKGRETATTAGRVLSELCKAKVGQLELLTVPLEHDEYVVWLHVSVPSALISVSLIVSLVRENLPPILAVACLEVVNVLECLADLEDLVPAVRHRVGKHGRRGLLVHVLQIHLTVLEDEIERGRGP